MSAVGAPSGQSVTYGYDPVTGRKISETDAAGKITRYAYSDRDQVTHVWGDVPVPVRYEYDAYGRLWKLHTFRANADFSGAQWPAGAGEGDVTEWVYDAVTGLLSSKIYADGRGVTYTYLSGGRLHTRTWSRTADGSALTTVYEYDPGTGELTDTDYSGSTPDIHFTYDRAGRKKTVTDALGTRIFTYDGILPDTEVLSGLYERTLDYDYETGAGGVPGRLTGFSAGSDYQVSYGYEHGRISGVNRTTGGQSGSVSYGYENGLLRSTLFSTGLNVTRTHDPVERYLTQVKNAVPSGILSQYDYSHDILGRRETVTYSGAAFGNSSYRRFGYNDRSEVVSSSAFAGSDITDTSAPLPPENRTYTYDPIGSRTAAAEAGQTITYTSNTLNQYTEIAAAHTDIPEYDDDGNLLKISADGMTMSYDGENRLSSAEYEGLLGDVNGDKSVDLKDAVASLQVAAGVPSPGVTVAGDVSADGKIGIGEAVHALQVSAGLRAAAAAARKTAFAYDYMGRRIKKAVYADEQLISETLFVYEGWNVIEEITRQNGTESSRYFVWGLDLSQSLQGAGGIGGLLCVSDATASYHYLYDANGNVGQLVNSATGEIAAHYEYDPFGNLTAKSGPYADANPFRFSTKYLDAETGLYNFGLRDYSAKLGRWTTRDPIEEEGGINLYCFVTNNPISNYDKLGLIITEDSSLEEIENTARNLIKSARKRKFDVAADLLENYLNGGGDKKLDTKWLRSFRKIKFAEETNQKRFQRDLIDIARSMTIGETKMHKDYYDTLIDYGGTGISGQELFWASGNSTLTSTGQFILKRMPCEIIITGEVEHEWYDEYRFDPGKWVYLPVPPWTVTDAAMNKLATHGFAKPFKMKADWHQYLLGRLKFADLTIFNWNIYREWKWSDF